MTENEKAEICPKCNGDGIGDKGWDGLYCGYCRGTKTTAIRAHLISYPAMFMSPRRESELRDKWNAHKQRIADGMSSEDSRRIMHGDDANQSSS